MLEVVTSTDKGKLAKQIQALEWQITQDTNDKDRQIHQKALEQLRRDY